ncbi:MAG TPA: NAD(P)/FAD-dependent oxidoreductase [Tenuifilaceae bacterium]|nr:NAD(P)/FAD-dependent oxidoreductase [Tenuifilaceae bacterium]HPQ35374.1 NAD(P)/FAD-dependent oxidoreductase [Tenuifilaceae bacterium]HRX69119.1 NAD(P)/FAD-dependent oxidoreductase [Tenuifilaceae bacterium]
MKDLDFDIVVIGAGPAGLLAAGKAATDGASVLLLEKMEKPARKLRITGKGRCNITNLKPIDEFIQEIKPEPRFLRNAFNEFFNNDIIELLENNGVKTVVERGQRVFPASGKAWDVAEALVQWAKGKGVTVENHSRVSRLLAESQSVVGADVENTKTGEKQTIKTKSVIIATGGKSYPATGSTGDGYMFAAETNHEIVPLRPTLVGAETEQKLEGAEGLTLKNVKLSLFINGKKQGEEFGELEVTDYGLSGPITIRLSRQIVDAINYDQKVELLLDLKPALDHSKLDARLQRDIQEFSRISLHELIRKLVPRQLVNAAIDNLGLAAQKPVSRLTADERKRIRLWLKEQRFTVTGYRSWSEAIATAGGVSLKQIDPKTMMSKLVQGLFFAGEVMDLDGSTGGFNLQIAYSTGWLAGKSAAIFVKS